MLFKGSPIGYKALTYLPLLRMVHCLWDCLYPIFRGPGRYILVQLRGRRLLICVEQLRLALGPLCLQLQLVEVLNSRRLTFPRAWAFGLYSNP